MSKMSKLGVVLLLVVLVFTPVMPMATSADQGSPIPTPTTTVDWGDLPGWANGPSSESRPDPEAAEDFRQALLDLRDTLQELYPYAQHYAQLSGQEPPPLPSRQLIQSLTHEELDIAREAFGDDYESFKQNVMVLKSLVLTPGKEPGEGQGQPSPDSFTIVPTPTPGKGPGEGQGQPSLSSFTTIPTPTPVTTPPPGITHKNHEQTNDVTGHLEEPGYPTSVGCPKERYSNPLMLGLHIGKAVLDLVALGADNLLCEGTLVTVSWLFGCFGTTIPQCLIWAILQEIALVMNAVYDGFSFCNANIDTAELEQGRVNTRIIHADLAEHDRGLTTRFNTMDKFLFNFRNLNLRQRIEDNIGSPEDSPIALFTLPRKVCISTELETLQATDPYAPEVIAGCGLLELVMDIVDSAIKMHQTAGQDVHNAQVEYDAAKVHYNNGKWKLAFTRLRNAYRDAVRP